MKRLFLLLILTVCCCSFLFAQSVLHVQLRDNSRFNISVNGRFFNRQGSSITVGDLPPGRHYIKIYALVYNRWGRGYDNVIFSGWVNTSYRMITNFVYDPYMRRARVSEAPVSNRFDENKDVAGNIQGQYNSRYNEGVTDNTNDDRNTTAQNKPDGNTDIKSSGAVASPLPTGTLTDEKVTELKKKCDSKKTDSERMTLLKTELSKETFNTIQVGTMMDWFLFESSKLEFAKWAYNKTADKAYYNDLSAKFINKSAKDELTQFVQKMK
jgi:hypothetical protein